MRIYSERTGPNQSPPLPGRTDFIRSASLSLQEVPHPVQTKEKRHGGGVLS